VVKGWCSDLAAAIGALPRLEWLTVQNVGGYAAPLPTAGFEAIAAALSGLTGLQRLDIHAALDEPSSAAVVRAVAPLRRLKRLVLPGGTLQGRGGDALKAALESGVWRNLTVRCCFVWVGWVGKGEGAAAA